jgi:hypothetical protein
MTDHDRIRELMLENLSEGFVFTAASPVHVSSDLSFLAFNMGVSESRRQSVVWT